MAGDASRLNGKLGGRPKMFATKLHQELIRLAEENAVPLARVLMDKAIEGDLPAIKEMMDRSVGKALQNVDVTTDGESLNERITKLDDAQLEQLIASVQGGVGRVALGETATDQTESVEVREGAQEAA
jgi:ribosomal protein L12E/L44/L45/RPP1/RPP2